MTLLEIAEFAASQHAKLWAVANRDRGLDMYDSGKLIAYRNILTLCFPLGTDIANPAEIETALQSLREQEGA